MDKKLQASTLVEVLVSMVIMMIVFTAAMKIYHSVTTSVKSASFQKARIAADVQIAECMVSSNCADQTITVDSITYVRTVRNYQDHKNLKEIKVEVFQQGRLLGTANQITLIKNDDPL